MPMWKASYTIGVPAIDKQHQELFARADSLLNAMRDGRSAAEVEELFVFLRDYCTSHFGSEAKLMAAKRYPKAAEHLAQHAEFERNFEEIVKLFKDKGASARVVIDLNRLIGDWLVNHIATIDTQLAAFLGDARETVRF